MNIVEALQHWLRPAPNSNDIVLTGLPRSGTTLTTKILSEQDNVIALNEPIQWKDSKTRRGAVKVARQSFGAFRKSLLHEGKAVARVKDGQLTDNHYERTKGKRRKVIQREEVAFDKILDSEFKLVLKHNSVFTLLLPELNDLYPYYAIVRNPLAVLGSWNSVDVPVSRGVMRHLDRFNPDLLRTLESVNTVLDKQLVIMDFYFDQYRQLDKSQILTYEDIIAEQGRVLSVITNSEVKYNSSLENKNVSVIYNPTDMITMGKKLLSSNGAYWDFYDKSSIEEVMSSYEQLM